MDGTNEPVPWITSMYFCQVEGFSGRVVLASSSGGVRGPNAEKRGTWWPQSMGKEVENLGSILLSKDFPFAIHLGVRFIAYGSGDEESHITVYDNVDLTVAVHQELGRVRFGTPIYDELPGVAPVTLPVLNLRLAHPGLYWVVARIGDGPSARLPLYVGTFDAQAPARHGVYIPASVLAKEFGVF